VASVQQTYGPSWYVSILPFCEQKPMSDLIEQMAVKVPNLTDISLTTPPTRVSWATHNQKIPWMLCPSSPLPQQELLRNNSKLPNCVVPTYTGIAGATNHFMNVLTVTGETPFWETRTKPKATGNAVANSTNQNTGQMQSWGGMLCPNECFGMAACLDGTSNTIVVSEKGDYFYANNTVAKSASRQRIDGSWFNGGSNTFTGGWWFVGTNVGTTSSTGPATAPPLPLLNLTTLRTYGNPAPANSMIGFNGKGVNFPLTGGAQSSVTVQGVGQGGLNSPLISGHPNIVLAVFMDGHTQPITKNTPPAIVKRLATRDDNQRIGDF
jgi:hypothetical protein